MIYEFKVSAYYDNLDPCYYAITNLYLFLAALAYNAAVSYPCLAAAGPIL